MSEWSDREVDLNPPKTLHGKLIALAHEASAMDCELNIAVYLLKKVRESHGNLPESLDDEIVDFINKHNNQ
jgi:hypothetical protein